MLDRLLKILDDDRAAGAIAAMALGVITWVVRNFGKIPRLLEYKRIERRNRESIVDGAKRDNILNELKATGAKYIHLVRYHNGGGALKRGTPIYLSVDIEKTGISCEGCLSHCRTYKGYVPPIIDEWQKIRIKGAWFGIVENTVLNPDDVNVVNYEDLDHEHREIWDRLNLKEYHEIFVLHKNDCFYCIGLSFCSRFQGSVHTSGVLSLASRQLANLL
jgi:hypothetical protein